MPSLSIADLLPGDVLLYRSSDSWRNVIAAMIRKIDGTEVSHAGLYIGEGLVSEALIVGNGGLHSNPINKSFAGCDWIEVRRLPGGLPTTPVLEVADKYVAQKNRYAFEQIFLLAPILLTRKLDLDDGLLRKIIVGTFDKANELINQLLDAGREPMICSEFVFRTYDEVDPDADDPYSLEISVPHTSRHRRLFSRRRLREKSFEATGPEQSVAHPESLLMQLNEVAPMRQRSERFAEGRPPMTEEQLEELMAEYVELPQRMKASGSPIADTVPEVSKAQIKEAARDYVATLADVSPSVCDGSSLFNSKLYSSMSLESRGVAAIADFVTPGDLLRSASLVTVGRISF